MRLQYQFDAVVLAHASAGARVSHLLEAPKPRIAVPHTPGPGSGSRTLVVIIVDPCASRRGGESQAVAVRIAGEEPRLNDCGENGERTQHRS